LIAARGSVRARQLSVQARWLAVGVAIATALFAGIGLLGNAALSRSESAREHGNLPRAASAARSARFWMPWSAEPWAALGRAQLAAGLVRESQQSFRKALSVDRGDWQLWYDLASASSGPTRHRALVRATALFPRSKLVSRARREEESPK
jgi:hypothetical protein